MDLLSDLLNAIADAFIWLVNRILDIYNDVEVCFTRNLSVRAMLRTYWFLFFVEFPRYYLLEFFIAIWFKFTYRQRKRRKDVARMLLFSENPLVSILVPGKNEGPHIYKLTQSLKDQTYQNYEIIVVDDGSDDATPLICKDLEKNGLITHYLRLHVRGGKASAANLGLQFASGKYIVHLDADSSLDRDALENILIPFYLDPKVKGVGGTVKVRNSGDSICASLQALEYLKTIMVGRIVTSSLGIYHIISGAFGAFDAEAMRNVGAWDIGPGLDGDITQKLRKGGYKVVFANEAVCLTNVPTKWYALYKQRKRWSRSLVRFRIRKHADILIPNKNFNLLNWMSNMESILYDSVFNYLWLIYMINLIFTYTDRLLEILLVGWLIRFFFSVIAFFVILLLTERPREELKIAKFLPLSTFYTGYFLRITRLIGHTTEFFFFSSYKDKWNPRKTSILAQLERQ